MKIILHSEFAGQVATVGAHDGYLHLSVAELENVIAIEDARALAAMLLFAATEVERW